MDSGVGERGRLPELGLVVDVVVVVTTLDGLQYEVAELPGAHVAEAEFDVGAGAGERF